MRTVIVVGKLRYDEMQNEIEQIAEAQDQQHLPEAVSGREIRDCENSRADSVPDDDAARFPEAEL